jgi:hypothetical protein
MQMLAQQHEEAKFSVPLCHAMGLYFSACRRSGSFPVIKELFLFGGGGRTTGKLHVYALSVDLRKTLSAF